MNSICVITHTKCIVCVSIIGNWSWFQFDENRLIVMNQYNWMKGKKATFYKNCMMWTRGKVRVRVDVPFKFNNLINNFILSKQSLTIIIILKSFLFSLKILSAIFVFFLFFFGFLDIEGT